MKGGPFHRLKRGLFSGDGLFFVSLLLLAAAYLAVVLPPFPALNVYMQCGAAVEILDSSGNELYVAPLEEGMRRQYRPLEEVPVDLQRIFILAEDKRFFLHPGVDPVALVRSAVRFLLSGDTSSGASTITMQLARMVLNSQDRRTGGLFARKLQEIVAAVRIEARLDKERILDLWLNGVPFGHRSEGVTAAARRFFDSDLHSLTSAQVLALALIPRNPTRYNSVTHPERAAEAVMRLAGRLGIAVDADTVLQDIREAGWGMWPDEAPHFSRMCAAAAVNESISGRVRTTLDLDLQRFSEELLYVYLDRSADSRIRNGAVLVIENATGEILAYVGSQRFTAPEGGQIDGVRVRNQPGSTVKPFLYAFALERGYSPNDVIADVPTDYGSSEVYVPRNFDRRYHGPVRLRTALASSLNIPATTMLERLGVESFLSFLADFGFDFEKTDGALVYEEGGLGVALGNAPVSLYELVRAFSVFPRGGVFRELSRLMGAGNSVPVERPAPAGKPAAERRVISESTAWLVYRMLSDPAERVTGFGMVDPFGAYTEAAVKTGTSSRNQHIWALAASGAHTVGVWLGNFAGETVIGRTGSSVPAQLALEILKHLDKAPVTTLRGTSAAAGSSTRVSDGMPGGANLSKLEICTLSGMRAGPYCPATRYEYVEGTAPAVCDFHMSAPTGSAAAVYPPDFASWAEGTHRNAAFVPAAGERLEIRYPVEGAVYFYDEKLPPDMQAVRLEVIHGGGEEPSLLVNGKKHPDPPVASNEVMASWMVPLTRGTMRLEVHSGLRNEVRCIEVR